MINVPAAPTAAEITISMIFGTCTAIHRNLNSTGNGFWNARMTNNNTTNKAAMTLARRIAV